MMQYAWPGNVRELEHTLERAVLMCQTGEIQVSDLGLNVQQRQQGQNLEELSIEEVEGILVRKALQRFHGNVSQAAEALGLEPRRAVSPDGTLWTLVQAASSSLLALPRTTSALARDPDSVAALEAKRRRERRSAAPLRISHPSWGPHSRNRAPAQTLSPALRKTHRAVRHTGRVAGHGLRHLAHLDAQLDAGRKDFADGAGSFSCGWC